MKGPWFGTTWANRVLARLYTGMLASRGVSREWYLNSLHKRGSILPLPPSPSAPSALAPAVEEEEDAFGRGKQERVLRLAEISGGDL